MSQVYSIYRDKRKRFQL